MESKAGNSADSKGFTQSRAQEANLVSVPITQFVLCDISNVMGSRKSSARSDKAKRVRKKSHACHVESVSPREKKVTKRLASEVDCNELPSKKRLVSHFDHELKNLMVEAELQPRQNQ